MRSGKTKTCGCSLYNSNKPESEKQAVRLDHKIRRRERYKNDPEKRKAAVNRVRMWVQNNREYVRDQRRIKEASRRQKPHYRLHCRMSAGIRASINQSKNGSSWEQILGYTAEDLRRHLEAQFKPGMNWDKLMAGEIHIDHIIPKSKFTFKAYGDSGFRQCWAMENLRPEWATKNMSRGARILEPSQIALGI